MHASIADFDALFRYHHYVEFPTIPFVVLDTETTGFIPRVNRVIEFASVRVEDGEIRDEYEQLISIGDSIPEPVQVLTRIRPENLEGNPTFEEAQAEILNHIGEDALIVGQNVGFDIRMLKGEGIDLSERPWIDTSMIASLVFPELASYSLSYVSTVLGLRHEPVHRALGDVHATLELLGRCWERLLELPADLREIAQFIMQKSSPGYQLFFEALPVSRKKKQPGWLVMPEPQRVSYEKPPKNLAKDILALPKKGEVRLVEEPLDPITLQSILEEAVTEPQVTHWIAVKNLHAALRRLTIPDGARVIQPPFALLDRKSAAALAAQESYTADEGTLALKLAWYEPETSGDLPIHGDERGVWKGKLACTESSDTYTEQFQDIPSVILLDHWQFLSLLADPEHAAHAALTENAHIVIDDSSMLEDTATKAYGWYCVLDTLRASAEGDERLTKFTDLLQLWIEKVREFKDLRYLTVQDLSTPNVRGLREQLEEMLSLPELPNGVRRQLEALGNILNQDNLKGRIVWVDQRQDGAQFLSSVPERVGALLQEYLYNRFPVTLLVPPGGGSTLREIIPAGTAHDLADEIPFISNIDISFPEDVTLETLLTDPPSGKTVILVSSRGSIEDLFVKYTESLEKKGVTLICQNLSGGQGRMQAEFTAAASPTVWLLTPWTFEGIELPPHSIDHLVINTLPFDHPAHAVISKRAERYENAFMEYSLPRLEHRLFRLIRTFCRYRTPKGNVQVLDNRLRTKKYGKEVLTFLDQFSAEEEVVVNEEDEEGQMQLL